MLSMLTLLIVEPLLYFYAVGAGIISFISPCNLALLPAFMSYVISTAKNRKESFMLSVLYSIGFAVTFAIIGVIFLAGVMTLENRAIFNLLAGIITIALAIYVFFNKEIQHWFRKLRIKANPPSISDLDDNTLENNSPENIQNMENLEKDTVKTTAQRYSGFGGAFILGFSTGSSWIACVTPVFGTILTVGSVQGEYSTALYLMILYGLGIMVPFILLGTLLGELNARILAKMIRWGSIIGRIFALLLMWIGVEMILSAYGLPGVFQSF
ncbi:MAG: cytochrome c biogenesis CcdA family protein [Promethearchaeota archaeon]